MYSSFLAKSKQDLERLLKLFITYQRENMPTNALMLNS